MFISDIITDGIQEAKMIYGRKGKTVVKKYRCTFGKRKGRLVANPAQCSKPIDLKKRFVLKRTKAQKGARMARKARFTKKFNPASKAVQRMNKAMRR